MTVLNKQTASKQVERRSRTPGENPNLNTLEMQGHGTKKKHTISIYLERTRNNPVIHLIPIGVG